jgi:2-polyprenyl-3-methyl-5-hydroxy-6-metoxy-1,4-benzoquinol methylase
MMLRDVIRRFVPLGVRRLIGRGKRLFVYSNYDSSEYWKRRAAEPGQAAVLWRNREYNELYRADQRQVMEPWITQLQPSARILDIGCGIGIVSRMILDQRTDVTIDAVDFDEMVAVARATLAHPSIRYIAAAAETYRSETEHYDLIISSAS